MNNMSPITRAFLTVGMVFHRHTTSVYDHGSLSTTASKLCKDMVLTTPSLPLILLLELSRDV